MRIEHSFHHGFQNPVDRILRVHQRSLALAQADRVCASSSSCQDHADPNQCRIVVNALRREIDRLQTGIIQTHVKLDRWPAAPDGRRVVATNDLPKACMAKTPLQLGPPLGDISALSPDGEVPSARGQVWFSRLIVTNVGTLIDVLT